MKLSDFNKDYDAPKTLKEYYLLVEAATLFLLFDIVKNSETKMVKLLNAADALNAIQFAERFNLKHLRLAARYKALTEFNIIQNSADFLNLNRTEVLEYLSDVHLYCDKEFDVFKASMKWLQHNSNEKTEQVVFLLLNCLDFNELFVYNLNHMVQHTLVKQYNNVVDVLNFIITERKKLISKNYNNEVKDKAIQLIASKHRSRSHVVGFICRNNCKEVNSETAHVHW